jgi:hypothetical protein
VSRNPYDPLLEAARYHSYAAQNLRRAISIEQGESKAHCEAILKKMEAVQRELDNALRRPPQP